MKDSFKLMYQLYDIYRCKRDGKSPREHIGWRLWIGNEKLLKETNEKYNINIPLGKSTEISDELANSIHEWYFSRTDLIGIYGDQEEHLN